MRRSYVPSVSRLWVNQRRWAASAAEVEPISDTGCALRLQDGSGGADAVHLHDLARREPHLEAVLDEHDEGHGSQAVPLLGVLGGRLVVEVARVELETFGEHLDQAVGHAALAFRRLGTNR